MGNVLEVVLNILSWRDLLRLLQVLSVLSIHLYICYALAKTSFHLFLYRSLISADEDMSARLGITWQS